MGRSRAATSQDWAPSAPCRIDLLVKQDWQNQWKLLQLLSYPLLVSRPTSLIGASNYSNSGWNLVIILAVSAPLMRSPTTGCSSLHYFAARRCSNILTTSFTFLFNEIPRSRAGCWDLRRIIPLERCHQSALAVTFNLITNKSAGLQLNFTDHVAIPKNKNCSPFQTQIPIFCGFFLRKCLITWTGCCLLFAGNQRKYSLNPILGKKKLEWAIWRFPETGRIASGGGGRTWWNFQFSAHENGIICVHWAVSTRLCQFNKTAVSLN